MATSLGEGCETVCLLILFSNIPFTETSVSKLILDADHGILSRLVFMHKGRQSDGVIDLVHLGL